MNIRYRLRDTLIPLFLFLAVAAPVWPQTGSTQEPPETVPPGAKRTILDLKYEIKDLAGKVQDLQVKETDLEVQIDLPADVLFDFDKADIRTQAVKALEQAAAVIREKASGVVRIEGHTDSKGTDPYNQKLSDRRAQSVKNWFATKGGLKNVRFATRGYGARKPVVPNTKPDGSDDPTGRQKNRRVEIIMRKR